MGDTVVALSAVVEPTEMLELEVGNEMLLVTVVKVGIDEIEVDNISVDEAGTIDSVHVSSPRDNELVELEVTPVVVFDRVIDVDSYEVTRGADEYESIPGFELGDEVGDEFDGPEEALAGELASEVVLPDMEVLEAAR